MTTRNIVTMVVAAAAVLLVILVVSGCLFVVQQNEYGVVTEFGKVVDINVQEPHEQDLSLQKSNIEIITKALEKHHGNRKLAAKEIGTSERSLYRWIKKYHLE